MNQISVLITNYAQLSPQTKYALQAVKIIRNNLQANHQE